MSQLSILLLVLGIAGAFSMPVVVIMANKDKTSAALRRIRKFVQGQVPLLRRSGTQPEIGRMNKRKAKTMFEEALRAVGDSADWHPEDMAKQWRELDEKEFLSRYCWVVYTANWNVDQLKKEFPIISKVFKHFDPKAVARMKRVPLEKLPNRNEKKANGFLKGAKMVHSEGWDGFKKRLKTEGMDMLEELGGIGPVLKKHLAMNIGLADTPKDDVHLRRCAKHCNASVDELVAFLAAEFKMQRHQVDAILWEWCANHRPF